MRLLDRTGEFTAEVPTSATGHFRFFAGPGEWTLRTLAPRIRAGRHHGDRRGRRDPGGRRLRLRRTTAPGHRSRGGRALLRVQTSRRRSWPTRIYWGSVTEQAQHTGARGAGLAASRRPPAGLRPRAGRRAVLADLARPGLARGRTWCTCSRRVLPDSWVNFARVEIAHERRHHRAAELPRARWCGHACAGRTGRRTASSAPTTVELFQGMLLPGRQASFSDIVANTAGALLGALRLRPRCCSLSVPTRFSPRWRGLSGLRQLTPTKGDGREDLRLRMWLPGSSPRCVHGQPRSRGGRRRRHPRAGRGARQRAGALPRARLPRAARAARSAPGASRSPPIPAAAADATVHFVCVGTPQRKGENAADISYVDAAIESILRRC